ncbi:MAG: ATP-binding protein [Caldilineales bacterium]
MSPRLADRLSAARRRRFIGRVAEQALFESAIHADELPFYVLHVHGPGGVGKTSLLAQFTTLAERAGVLVLAVDARNMEPTPGAFLASLGAALGIDLSQSPAEALAARPGRAALLIDTYELLAPLDGWLRETFLPQLPERVLTVLASRHPPSPGWRADPGWQPFLRLLALNNLTPNEGRDYLEQRNVPAADLPAVLDFTHSYPLALSLVADLYDQRPGFHFEPLEAADVVKLLLEQFLQRAPGPAHRAALEACALVRVTTEGLLAELLTLTDAHDLFEWLRGLTFIETRPGGLFPHDIAREALVTDLRWRNPGWYAELHRRARVHYTRRLQESQGPEQQLALFDFVYLHRDNPAVRPFFEWQASGRAIPDRMHGEDVDLLVQMVERHEGSDSARLARFWLARQPENVIVFRDSAGQPAGFLLQLALDAAGSGDLAVDPATAAAWDFLEQEAPLRAGESATYFRFWLAADAHQSVSPIQSVIFINMVRHYFTPGLAYTFYACVDPAFWQPVFAYADLARLPALDFAVGARSFGVYGHDWRAMPPLAWLELLGQREIAMAPETVQPRAQTQRLAVLSQQEFFEAVGNALRDYSRPDVLRGSPLVRSQVVTARAGLAASEKDRAAALRALLTEAADQMRGSPKENKFYRAVYHTYIQPAATQEQAAELLDVPFSSYRRHLKSGMARIAEILWTAEAGGTQN